MYLNMLSASRLFTAECVKLQASQLPHVFLRFLFLCLYFVCLFSSIRAILVFRLFLFYSIVILTCVIFRNKEYNLTIEIHFFFINDLPGDI